MQKTQDVFVLFCFFAERRSSISRGMSGMNVKGQCSDSRDLFLTIDVTVSCRNDLVPEILISLPLISQSHPIDYYFQSQDNLRND